MGYRLACFEYDYEEYANKKTHGDIEPLYRNEESLFGPLFMTFYIQLYSKACTYIYIPIMII